MRVSEVSRSMTLMVSSVSRNSPIWNPERLACNERRIFCEPKAVQRPHPPILIGGMGPKVVQPVAARHAQIWHFFVRDGDPEKVKEVCRGFDEICHKVGRDPAEVEKATSLRAADLTGSSKEIRMRVQALADAGVRHLVLQLAPPFDRALLRRFAKEVMGGFRASR